MAYQSKHTGKQIDDGIDAVGSKLGKTDDLQENKVTFEEAIEQEDLESGDKLGILIGKIKKWIKSLGKVALSDDYDDLKNKPNIPQSVSELDNDAGYISSYTETDPSVPTHVKNIKSSDITSWNNKAETSAIPIKTSQLANDSSFVTESFVRNEIANAQLGGDNTEIDLSGFATKDELASKVDKETGKSLVSDAEIARLANVTNYNDAGIKASINEKLDKTGDASNATVAFSQSSTRTNISTGEKLTTIFGKIMKWFADLKTVAFTGAYIDLSGTPTKLSDFTNDKNFISSVPSEYVTETELTAKGYITGYTETDPTVPSWAKASTKPSYSKSEVGLGNVDNVKQYSASNPPPYPVTSVNGQTGAVTVPVPTNISDLVDDVGIITLDATSPIEINGKWYGSEAQYEAIAELGEFTEYNIIIEE